MGCINCRIKDQKKPKIYIIVRIEFSTNKNTPIPETKTMFNLLDISKITRANNSINKKQLKMANIYFLYKTVRDIL